MTRAERFKAKLAKRYGNEIIGSLISMQNGIMNLRDVGEKHGFTREYARQIFEKATGYKYTVVKNNRISQNRDDAMMLKTMKKNPQHKVAYFKKGSNVYKGALVERRVLGICSTLGYDVKPYINDSIDLIINDYLVDVKSAYIHRVSSSSKTPQYHFRIQESQEIADFIICYIVPLNKFFIIPFNKFPKGRNLFIPSKRIQEWDDSRGHKKRVSKYYQYENAWYLLKPKPAEIYFNRSLLTDDSHPRRQAELNSDNSRNRGEYGPCLTVREGKGEETRPAFKQSTV